MHDAYDKGYGHGYADGKRAGYEKGYADALEAVAARERKAKGYPGYPRPVVDPLVDAQTPPTWWHTWLA